MVWFTLLTACGHYGLETVAENLSGPRLSTDPAGSVSFGRQEASGRTYSEELYLVSAGDEAVYVADMWIESEERGVFDVGDLPFPRSLDPGAEMPVNILFTPEDDARYEGSVFIEIGWDGKIIERTLSGTGCSPRDC
jgi:hypothetical protein